jgi:hypothetical protein
MTRAVFWMIAFLIIFADPVPAPSAEFGQGGMSVIPAPLTPSTVSPPPPPPQPSLTPSMNTTPPPSGMPPMTSGFPGVSGIQALPTQSRLIVLTNPPGAKVYLGGFVLGLTPLDTRVYSGSNAMLEITKDGYFPESISVLLGPGKTINLQFSMKRITNGNP